MDLDRLALGTWLMGGMRERDPNNDDEANIAVIKAAIDNGIRLIDTAQNYANGRCEEIIGEATQGLPRDSFQILTKQRKERLAYDQVLEDCQASMQRLQVEYLDYFVCHAPNPEAFDMRDFFRAGNKLVEEGKVKHIGVSNFGPKMLQLAVEMSDTPIALNQIHFSLDDDDILSSGTYDFCVEHAIPMQAYRVLESLEKNQTALEVLRQIGNKHNLTVYQTALSYVSSYDLVAITVRASTKQQWDEIKAAINISLSMEEVAQIRAAHQDMSGQFASYLNL